MRILMFSNTFPPGYAAGAEVSNYHTLRGLITRGYRCTMCVLRNREEKFVNERYFLDGLPVHRVLLKPLVLRNSFSDIFDHRLYRYALEEIQSEKPDIAHITNISGSTVAPYIACLKTNTPVVTTLHDLWLLCANNMRYQKDGTLCQIDNKAGCGKCFRKYDYWGAIPRRTDILRKLTSNTRYFLSPSKALIEHHVKSGYDSNKFKLVPYGMDQDLKEGRMPTFIQHLLQKPFDGKTLVFGGGGIETKGARVVLNAIPTLRSRLGRFRLIVAGDGDILHQFSRFEEVTLLGKLPFKLMRHIYKLADLVLLPSVWYENLPLVIFESSQVGTPIVGSNVGGIPDIIVNGRNGYLFPVGDSHRMAELVISHFDLPGRRIREMKKTCRQIISEKYSLNLHLDKITAVYDEIVVPQ